MAVEPIRLNPPLTEESIRTLRAGDRVLLSGTIYTARDAAHKRIVEALREGREAPFPLEGGVLYYVGPAPAKPGYPVGPAGPTTSSRVDAYTLPLLEKGLRVMVGKGRRSSDVAAGMVRCGAIYLGAVGGAAALISRRIVSSQVVAYPELGTEAVHRLEVRDFPLIVVMDARGGCLYDSEPPRYRRKADFPQGESDEG